MIPSDAPFQSVQELFDVHVNALQAVTPELEKIVPTVLPALLDRLESGSRFIISGLGKSYHIGQKIAATMTSMGIPAQMLHPSEALHGDLGIVHEGDIALLLSYSGESRELLELTPLLRDLDTLLVTITGSPESSLAQQSHHVLPVPIPQEACPFNMAPTASALVTLAAADALAMLLCQARGFTVEEYARRHPSGAIGNGLFLSAKDIMRTGDRLAILPPGASIRAGIIAMGEARAGSVLLVDANQRLLGIVTDGDLRRHLLDGGDLVSLALTTIMTHDPVSIITTAPVVEVVQLFEKHAIDDVPVVDASNKLVGLIDLQDLPKIKLL